MGSSKKQTVSYWYHPTFQMVLHEGPFDKLLEIRGGDVTAWKGEMTASGSIQIDAANIWGGEEKEGGIQGAVDVSFGEMDAQPNAYFQTAIGADPSGHNGYALLQFNGGRYGAGNPYPKPISVLTQRIYSGWLDDECWYPEKAGVGEDISPTVFAEKFQNGLADYTVLEGSMGAFSVSGSRVHMLGGAARNRIEREIPLVDDAQFRYLRYRFYVSEFGGGDLAIVQVYDNTGTYIHGFNAAFGAGALRPLVGYNSNGGPTAYIGTGMLDTDQWYIYEATYDPSTVTLTCRIINADTNEVWGQVTLNGPSLPAARMRLWTDGDGADSFVEGIEIGYVAPGGVSMNPAHVIYDSLTCLQGEPAGAIDGASFRAAADVLFGESFGICTRYNHDRETIEQFRQRILDLIGAECSRYNGRWYLDLIRPLTPEQVAALPVLGDDDILDWEEDVSTIDDMVNQVAVKWFDPFTKQERITAPVQALAAINAMGVVSSEIKQYLEVPDEGLANRLAARDLQNKSTPTRRLRLTTNRRPYSWRKGSAFRLQVPKRGISDMVCRVADIDRGTLQSGAIRLVAVQDVFAMPETTYVVGQPPVPPPSQVPEPIEHQALMEAPYVELAGALGAAELSAMQADSGYVLAVGVRPGNGQGYALLTRPAGGDFDRVGTFDWCPSAVVVEAAGYLETEFTLAGASYLDRVELGSSAVWGDELVRVDALDRTTGAVVFGRGCGDTTPARHAAGERVYFYDAWAASDRVEYVAAEEVEAKLLPRTGTQELAESEAPVLSIELDQRAARPYPPGRLRVSDDLEVDQAYPESCLGELTVSWAHRDRVLQADQLVDAEVADIGPEAGTTYSVLFYRNDVLDHSETGISANESAPVVLGGNGLVRVEVWAARDGLDSWQAAAAEFTYLRTPHQPYGDQNGDIYVDQNNDIYEG